MSFIKVSTTEEVYNSSASLPSQPGFVFLYSLAQEFPDLPLISIWALIMHTLLTLVLPLRVLGI